MNESWILSIFTIGSTILAILAAQWRLSVWLSDRFTEFRNLIDSIKHELMQKIEYHERHDDERFQNVNNNLWEIKVRNAAKDNLMLELQRNIKGLTRATIKETHFNSDG